MEHQANEIRSNGPVVMAQVKHMIGMDQIVELIITAWNDHTKQLQQAHKKQKQ